MDQIIQREFERFITAAYDGLTAESYQYEHLRGAFFAGALIAFNNSLNGDLDGVMSVQRELQVFCREEPIATRVLIPEVS